MDAQSEYPHIPSYPDIVSALADFARLAQHVLGASTPSLHETFAQMLLSRLLHLCEMQRGALLLSTQYHADPKRSFWSLEASRKTLRILAQHGIDDDDLFALLTTFVGNQDEEVQMLSSDLGWMICQRMIPAPNPLHLDGPPEPFSAPLASTLRFFLLAETEKKTLADQAKVEKGQAVWPLVADAVGTVIVSLLQVERMHEMETATSHRDLRQMELLKAELLATVSHELRSPLASVKGYAATLLRHERRISREERHEFLLAIHDAGQRLEVVIDRLLEMSQLETATLPLQLESVDLVSVAREAITAREQRPGEVDTSGLVPPQKRESIPPALYTFVLRIEDHHGMPTDAVPLLQGDRRLLREVLDHLLENAVLYSPVGGVVEVGLRTREPDQAYLLSQTLAQTPLAHRSPVVFPLSWPQGQPLVEIWVQDHGIGIPGAHLEQIFQRFYRVDTSLTREVNGLGLGLAICKQIVALHDGILWAESEVGKGSTFHVLLPLNGHGLSQREVSDGAESYVSQKNDRADGD